MLLALRTVLFFVQVTVVAGEPVDVQLRVNTEADLLTTFNDSMDTSATKMT